MLCQQCGALALAEDEDGRGMVLSQELTTVPPLCCGMEQSLQDLVLKERQESSW